jgi:GTPase
MMAPRGTDPRLLNDPRPTNQTRRQVYEARMDAKAAARAELQAEREAGIWNDDEEFVVNKQGAVEKAGQAGSDDESDAGD